MTETRPTRYLDTDEQYGETTGRTVWRRGLVSVNVIEKDVVLGIVSKELLVDTGGLFCGLIYNDDERPSLLSQLGYSKFVLDYRNRSLLLTRSNVSAANAMPMYDLTPFGRNLHHYGVACQTVFVHTKHETNLQLVPSRPVVVVLDSGQTGCTFSDSWLVDLPVPVSDISGATLVLQDKSTVFESDSRYWSLSCFRLPWFTDPNRHPHIVVAGGTFLCDSILSVDAVARQVSIG